LDKDLLIRGSNGFVGCALSHEEIDFLGDFSKKTQCNTSVSRPSKLPGFTGN